VVTWEELQELHDVEETHMELWIDRDAIEMVVRAAQSCAEFLWEKYPIRAAIASVQEAVSKGEYDPLDVSSL
jgi:hypothetical protein